MDVAPDMDMRVMLKCVVYQHEQLECVAGE